MLGHPRGIWQKDSLTCSKPLLRLLFRIVFLYQASILKSNCMTLYPFLFKGFERWMIIVGGRGIHSRERLGIVSDNRCISPVDLLQIKTCTSLDVRLQVRLWRLDRCEEIKRNLKSKDRETERQRERQRQRQSMMVYDEHLDKQRKPGTKHYSLPSSLIFPRI